MTSRTRRGLAAAALCSAGLLVAGAPLIATANNDGKRHDPRGKRHDPPGKNHKKPAYGQPGFKPGKPGSAVLFARLSGKNEISMTGKRRAGDPDGKGVALVRVTKTNQVCAAIIVEGISTPTAANISQGKGHVNGSVAVGLAPPAAFSGTGDPAATAGCVAVDPGLAFDLRKNPHRYYVNVATTEFPAGAVRGQLGKKHQGWWWH